MVRAAATLAWLALAATTTVAVEASARALPLSEVLERELGLLRGAVDVGTAMTAMEQERRTLEHAASVHEHAGRDLLRRLSTYRVARESRVQHTKRRARALYKLARGGMLRLVFERPATGETIHDDRITLGRTIRWLIVHDMRELSVHARAEERARTELLTATRELQAIAGIRMMESVQSAILQRVTERLEPALEQARAQRRRALREAPGKRDEALLRTVMAQRRALASGATDPLASGLYRPVPGAIVGRYGSYRDRVLQVTSTRSGVELEAWPGQRVSAVADGEVAFVGDLPGFDRVVVVDHGGGHLSLTGRLATTTVAEHERVERGTVIGRVMPKTQADGLGTTVYLELRHGERPIDPTPLLR